MMETELTTDTLAVICPLGEGQIFSDYSCPIGPQGKRGLCPGGESQARTRRGCSYLGRRLPTTGPLLEFAPARAA
jgi:hypothetical protein